MAVLRRIPADVRLFLAFLALIVPVRAVHTSNIRWMSVDGSLYTEVARNVRDGLGLVSNLSLYHAGVEQFPYPTSLYPLWPLVLGYAAKIGDLLTLTHWLPLALHLASLGLLFVFGRRAWPEPMFPRALPAFHAGHLFALLFAVQRDNVNYSSLPYTEPLSHVVMFGFFARLAAKRGDLSLRWALEVGLWSAAAYFTRAQLLVVPIAVLGALALRWVVGPERGRTAAFALVATATLAAPMVAWYLHLRTFVLDAGPAALLRFDQNRATDLLSPLDIIVDHPTLLATVLDRLNGLLIAWNPLSNTSYAEGMWFAHWALPLAVPLVLVSVVGSIRREGVRAVTRALRHPTAMAWSVVLLVALGTFASVQLAHKHYNGEWYFDRRQGIPSLLLFALALGWVLRQARPLPAAIGALLLAGTLVAGGRHALQQATATKGELRAPEQLPELVAWLKRESADEPIVVAVTGGTAFRAGFRTKNVGYHWLWEETSYADVRAMVERLGARYLVFKESGTRGWRFRKESVGRLERDFAELPDRPDGYTILVPREAPPQPLAPKRVIVVGVDGASWKVMGPLIERGELPTFTRLMTEGASQLDFDTLDKTASPVVWTTVATGRMPEDHGVTDYTQEIPGQGKVPVTSDARKVPALWNVASDAGRTVSVINWWASWPAESVHGTIVSDHANPAAAGWMEGRYWNADPAALAALRKDTWPPEYADSLTTTWVDPAAFPLDDLDARGDFTDAQMAEVAAAPFNERTTYSWLKTFYAVDRPHWQIALDQLRTAPADLTMLYLRGPDPVQHYAWDTVEPFKYREVPANLDRDRGVVQGVYRYVDTFLADILASAGPDTTVIVLSDHGAEPSADAKKKKMERPGGHTRAAKGVLFLWGPDVRPGVKISKAGPLDIAPTVAWALGLPVAEDLPGRVLAEAFTHDFRARRGRSDTPTWGTRSANTGASASPADDSMMEQLRGLGYIE